MGRALLSLRGVSKAFGRTRVLEGVDLEVFPGEIVALAGENGSGKSTTARIIAGILQPDAGEIVIDGDSRRLVGPRQASATGICYVGQEPALVPTMSVADNLRLPSIRWWGGNRSQRPASIGHALARAGLDCDPARKVATLSAAQQTQLEIAKALLSNPRLLILDEVTTRMPDPSGFLELVAQMAEQGVGSILITHRFSEIKALADRVVVLRDGRIVGQLAGNEVSDRRLGEMMVGRGISLLERRPTQRREEIALRLDGLLVKGGRRRVDLTVREGEIVGVGGLMGSGRSRLLETVAGVRRPEEGRVLVGDVELQPGSVASARSAGMCFVPEDRNRQGLIRRATIQANIRLNAYPAFARPSASADRAVAEKMCAALSVKAPHIRVRVENLSGGNAQKVVFARELSRDPHVLVLDEPTRGVDIAARMDIYELIRSRVRRGAGVLIASSDMQELVTLCDRVVVLFEGVVAGELEGDDIDEEAIILLASGAAPTTAASAQASSATGTQERNNP